MRQPIVWTIAGSDPSGAAGIQADLKTFHRLGVHGCSLVTAVTAQNVTEMQQAFYVPVPHIAEQIHLLEKELPSQIIKLGMLGQIELIKFIINYAKTFSGKIIFDPVLQSSSGKNLFCDTLSYFHEIKKLLPYVFLLTPNIPEVEKILAWKIHSKNDVETAAKKFLALGVKNVLIKGGHFEKTEWSQDFFANASESFWLRSPKQKIQCRGTGCTLSSAIAACLGLGYDIKDAVVIAKMYINQAMRQSQAVISNQALLFHGDWPVNQEYLPSLFYSSQSLFTEKFPDCGSQPLGLYPIVDSYQWVERLLSQRVSTIQLRIKNKSGNELETEIKKSIALAKQYDARLFINDYWEMACRYGAYGVHLGQDDLHHADIHEIHCSGMRLGISTHCYYEVARAHFFKPSYIACGPIFSTKSKVMPFAPQGIENLKRWRKTLDYPLVAIGGINQSRLKDVLETGVDGVAMISEITHAVNPEEVIKKLKEAAHESFFY